MQKFAFTLFLAFIFVFSLSINTFAEGGIGHAGRSCPSNTTCLTEGDIPNVGKTCPPNTTCVADGQIPIGGLSPGNTPQENAPTIFKTLLDYLARMFR